MTAKPSAWFRDWGSLLMLVLLAFVIASGARLTLFSNEPAFEAVLSYLFGLRDWHRSSCSGVRRPSRLSLGLRMRLNDSWLFVAMALLMAGWAICIGLLETTLLNHTGIQLRWLGFVRVLAGFLAGGLVCYIGYLLAFSTLGHVFSGLTPSRTASILLSVFGAIGLGCWGVGLILPLEAVRPYIR